MTTSWRAAKNRYDQALSDLVRAAAESGIEAPVALELARVTCHRQLDDAIDREALRHPSPRRLIARAARYADLCTELWTRGAA